jgi:hypothetical protein
MKLSRKGIRNGVTATSLILMFGVAATISKAQDGRTPPSESPKSETPSAPTESSRSDPSPSSSSSSSSSSNNDSSRGSDPGSSSTSSDSSSGRSESRSSKSVYSGKDPRVTGKGTPRERVPVGKNPVPTTPTGGNGGPTTGGNRDRDRNRDRDHNPGHDRHRHRNRQDACYQVPAYDDTIHYQAGRYGTTGATPVDTRTAYERGYDDGLFTGANDARRGQTYDPQRSHFYNDTPGYRSSMGKRDVYSLAYRDGFLHGYREGYQNWQKYFAGGVFHR